MNVDEICHKQPLKSRYDVIVIGSGAGGSTLAYQLSRFGREVLIVERGTILRPEQPNIIETIGKYIYHIVKPDDELSVVGGQTKFYGSTLYRMRESDFCAVEHENGVSP